jgi:hypothetical protein
MSQKFVWELPDGICRFNPKCLKNLLDYQINQSEQKKTKKKYVLYFESVKEPKISMGATRRNSPQEPEIKQDSS